MGSASFFAAALLSALAYTYCHHLNRPSAESAVIHPSTPNHLTYNKQGNTTPKNEKYIPMEFKVGAVCSWVMSPLLCACIWQQILCLHTVDAKQEQSPCERRDVQPLLFPASLQQHVHHHLLPSQSKQVRLPSGLPLQDLHAQLRGGQAVTTKQKKQPSLLTPPPPWRVSSFKTNTPRLFYYPVGQESLKVNTKIILMFQFESVNKILKARFI